VPSALGPQSHFSNTQLPELWRFLVLVILHAAQDVIEHFYRGQNVRAFVKHHAISALRHCGIGDFCSRRPAFFRLALKHLGCPDDRQLCGFAHPEYLFLYFCKSFPAAFHCQITSGNHYASRILAHCCQQEPGQGVEALDSLHLRNDAEPVRRIFFEFLLQGNNVLGFPDERQAYRIGMLGNKFEIGLVRFRQSAKSNVTFWKVNAFVAAKPAPGRLGMRNFDKQFLIRDGFDDAFDFAVIQMNWLIVCRRCVLV